MLRSSVEVAKNGISAPTQNDAREAPTYAKIIGYGAGYWLWVTSGVLVIVSGAIGLMKERQAILISDQ